MCILGIIILWMKTKKLNWALFSSADNAGCAKGRGSDSWSPPLLAVS